MIAAWTSLLGAAAMIGCTGELDRAEVLMVPGESDSSPITMANDPGAAGMGGDHEPDAETAPPDMDDEAEPEDVTEDDGDAKPEDDSETMDGDVPTPVESADDGEVEGDGDGDDGTNESDPAAEQEPDEPPVSDVPCLRAQKLWADDFETGDYSRWTSGGYVSVLNQGGCFESGFSSEQVRSGERAHKTAIACASGANHRIYGGLQFAGDSVMPRFTNTGVGIDAPNGIVVTYWSWLDAPGFGNGRWFNFFTTNNACNYTDTVVTFGLEDPSNQIAPAHILSTGGTLQSLPTRTSFPFRQWARTTVYLNYYTGVLHVWQDGVPQVHGTFRRNSNQICQFHWGLYANGANTHITLFEDDMSVWKLSEPLTNFKAEPWLGETQPVCE